PFLTGRSPGPCSSAPPRRVPTHSLAPRGRTVAVVEPARDAAQAIPGRGIAPRDRPGAVVEPARDAAKAIPGRGIAPRGRPRWRRGERSARAVSTPRALPRRQRALQPR